MNLDRAFCVSPCSNAINCNRVLSHSVIRAAEKIGKQLSQADFRDNCTDYKKLIPSKGVN